MNRRLSCWEPNDFILRVGLGVVLGGVLKNVLGGVLRSFNNDDRGDW